MGGDALVISENFPPTRSLLSPDRLLHQLIDRPRFQRVTRSLSSVTHPFVGGAETGASQWPQYGRRAFVSGNSVNNRFLPFSSCRSDAVAASIRPATLAAATTLFFSARSPKELPHENG